MAMDEKETFLDRAVVNGTLLFFEHDPVIECCSRKKTDRGVRMDKGGLLKDFL
jgi:hypothetical protein